MARSYRRSFLIDLFHFLAMIDAVTAPAIEVLAAIACPAAIDSPWNKRGNQTHAQWRCSGGRCDADRTHNRDS